MDLKFSGFIQKGLILMADIIENKQLIGDIIEKKQLTGDISQKSTLIGILNNPIKTEVVPTVTIAVGKVEDGEKAEVENVGTPENAIFDFTLPRGPKGESGDVNVGSISNIELENILNQFIGG